MRRCPECNSTRIRGPTYDPFAHIDTIRVKHTCKDCGYEYTQMITRLEMENTHDTTADPTTAV